MPPTTQFVAQLRYTPEQKNAINEQFGLAYIPADPAGPSEFKALFDKHVGPQATSHPDLLFVGFPDLQAVKRIAAALDLVKGMVQRGIQYAGVSPTFTKSPYEMLFGAHRVRSHHWLARVSLVQARLTDIANGTAAPWIIRRTVNDDVASWPGGNKLDIGSGFGTAQGHWAAGFLLHEIGHAKGRLEDICRTCHGTEATLTHYKHCNPAQPAKCGSNNTHKSAGVSGHFSGKLDRVKSLASLNKNLTIWNADSYRWYCLYLYRGALDREVGAGRVGW